jgi:protein-disulfide isomerase
MFQRVSKTRTPWCSMLALLGLMCIPTFVTAQALPSVVATVQGQPIAADDLTQALRGELLRLEMQRYQLFREKLDELIADKIFSLEATQRGVSAQQFIHDEISAKIQPVTPQQVQAFYEANKNRIKQPLEKVSEQLTSYLQQQAREQRRQALLKELQARYPVMVALRAPTVEVATEGEPTLGPSNAPITIVEFSDFQCPYCRQAQSTVKRIMAEYEGKIKLVFRDFPLRNMHPLAQKAAEAAQCAAEQQKFWPYHDKLFTSTNLQMDELKQFAQELELNLAQFTTCLDSGKSAAGIDTDMQAGQQAGVNATPTFFVNGSPLSGAASYERFKELVDAALEQGQSIQRTN